MCDALRVSSCSETGLSLREAGHLSISHSTEGAADDDRNEQPPGGAVAEVKGKGEELVSSAQEQITTKAHELGGEAEFRIREQLDQRSTQAGEQVQSIGKVLQSGANQLRSEGKDMPAKVVEEVARRADDLGGYLQSAQADRILDDIERFRA